MKHHPPTPTAQKRATSGRMLVTTAVLVVALFSTLLTASPANAIVGGSAAQIKNFPWQVAMLFNGAQDCGGSIIDADSILTASHCVEGRTARQLGVRAGVSLHTATTGQDRAVARIIMHPRYNDTTLANDVAILELDRPLQFNANVQPIELVPADKTALLTGPNQPAVVSGWGALAENGGYPIRLQSVELPVVSDAVCNRQLARFGESIQNSTMLCAGGTGTDSCYGDSGGPLVSRDSGGTPYLIGVVSWGLVCAQRGVPGVYAQVSTYRNWVSNFISDAPTNPPPTTPSGPTSTSLFSNIGTARIQDNRTTIKNISVSGVRGRITDVNVILTGMTHTFPADLRITVKAPDGRTVVLSNGNGGGANISGVRMLFNDEARTQLSNSRIVSSAYQPDGSLATFDGGTANGRWSVRISDTASGDVGSLTGARIMITTG